MKNNNKSEKQNVLAIFFQSILNYIKTKYSYIILFVASVLIVSALNFMKISTSETIQTFSLDNFEIGMIADQTIIANKSLPPDDLDPVSIQKGEKITKKGFAITEESYAKLKKMSASPVYIDYRAFANNELYIILFSVMWYILFTFLAHKRKLLFREVVLHVIFLILAYAVTAFLGKLTLFSDQFSICIVIPASLFVMLVTILYGNLSAIFLSFILSLGILNATGWMLVPFLFSLLSCLSSLAIVRKIEKRLDLVFASLVLSILQIVYMIILLVIFNESFDGLSKLIIGIAINGFLSGILTIGFLPLLETILNTTSVFRLMELSDLNTNFMQQFLVRASGTYNHSMMVAQLAEGACREIGANPLIARVGAYYHDIGKLEHPEYFVENQKGVNKHNDINPSLSASVIKSHVRIGVEKGHQLHLPQPIIDIIAEHHGNSVISYFYNEASKKDPTLTPEDFAYPGNPPSSRESGVVMLADTVEAACRTLENPSVTRLEKFITTLIAAKVEHNQLDNCDLTFRDLSTIKKCFVQLLAGYYHSRIEYPDQKDPSESNEKQENKETVKDAPKTDTTGEMKLSVSSDTVGKSDKSTKSEKTDKQEKNDKTEKSDKQEKTSKTSTKTEEKKENK